MLDSLHTYIAVSDVVSPGIARQTEECKTSPMTGWLRTYIDIPYRPHMHVAAVVQRAASRPATVRKRCRTNRSFRGG